MKPLLTVHEEEQLLGRPVRTLLDVEDRAAFVGGRVAITGAGGSVGSELARQIAACRPERLTLIDHSEYALFQIEQELSEQHPDVTLDPVLCDVTQAGSVTRALQQARPQVIFHAAAYKHVTMAERAICAAARVNVIGTTTVMEAAREVGAQVVLVSTDKAAAPRSVMGATKRLAEMAVCAAGARGDRRTIVRFGNVLASSGSVVELMRERVRRGQPVVVTDPNATRYFMTVTEAASLMMKASTFADGGETFWLDMGRQVRIGDLVERLLSVEARLGYPEVPIDIIGLRTGEKLVETLAEQGIAMCSTPDPRIFVAQQQAQSASTIEAALKALRWHVSRDHAHGVLKTLAAVIPDFMPSTSTWRTVRADGQARGLASPAPDPLRPDRVSRMPPSSGAWRVAPSLGYRAAGSAGSQDCSRVTVFRPSRLAQERSE